MPSHDTLTYSGGRRHPARYSHLYRSRPRNINKKSIRKERSRRDSTSDEDTNSEDSGEWDTDESSSQDRSYNKHRRHSSNPELSSNRALRRGDRDVTGRRRVRQPERIRKKEPSGSNGDGYDTQSAQRSSRTSKKAMHGEHHLDDHNPREGGRSKESRYRTTRTKTGVHWQDEDTAPPPRKRTSTKQSSSNRGRSAYDKYRVDHRFPTRATMARRPCYYPEWQEPRVQADYYAINKAGTYYTEYDPGLPSYNCTTGTRYDPLPSTLDFGYINSPSRTNPNGTSDERLVGSPARTRVGSRPQTVMPGDSRSEAAHHHHQKPPSGPPAPTVPALLQPSAASLTCSGVLGLKTYQYQPLKNTEIRLVKVLPERMSELKCEIMHMSLDRGLDYIAISYAWGDRVDTTSLVLGTVTIPVALSLHGALKAVREKERSVMVWIDALCIDQQNKTEREAQVRLMGRIYSQASFVAIWLGPDKDDSELAVQLLQQVARDTVSSVRVKSSGKYADSAALLALLKRDYWKRLWVSNVCTGDGDDTGTNKQHEGRTRSSSGQEENGVLRPVHSHMGDIPTSRSCLLGQK
jgi:hypothetical protein